MTPLRRFLVIAFAALAAACSGEQDASPPGTPQVASQAAGAPQFVPVATTLELMESVLGHAAEEYWGAVSIVVDERGVTENYPQTDEEWDEVWAAAMSIAESGNLLMMEPRAVDQGEWVQWSKALIERGREAVSAAAARDPEQVLAAGEQIYYVCLGCHERYIVTQP